jgi:phosphoribosyl 1,2-cyclic phosphodiesterase
MKRFFYIFLILIPGIVNSQSNFEKYFADGSLRYDFILGGDSSHAIVYPAQIKSEPFWGGSKVNLIDYFDYGTYRIRVYDQASGTLIFSKGFCTLFQEWQTTAEAKSKLRTFYQSAIFPFPKQKIKLEIDSRLYDGTFKNLHTAEIDPTNYFIRNESSEKFKVKKIIDNGNSEKKVDIVILAEGYRSSESNDFFDDSERLTSDLFDDKTFKDEKGNFNVYAVMSPSLESGTDIPGQHIYRNTRFNSTFYTFDVSRYLTSDDLKDIYDAASSVPYDYIIVLVNTNKYGGGGFYNLVSVCSADNELSKNVFIHEFGHAFAGLADEYYTSDVAYEDFYNLKVEPWEPNITTLVDFNEKWKSMIPDSIPVPTPRTPQYKKSIGVFEGGGYMAKGIYSPVQDCRMKSNEAPGFCPACQVAIRKAIQFYTK